MQWQDAAGIMLKQAIARAQAGSDNPARCRELATYFIKTATQQAKTKKFYTLAFAGAELLRRLERGATFRELRARFPAPTQSEPVADVVISHTPDRPVASATISPPAVIRGTVSEAEGRAEPTGLSENVRRALEDYV